MANPSLSCWNSHSYCVAIAAAGLGLLVVACQPSKPVPVHTSEGLIAYICDPQANPQTGEHNQICVMRPDGANIVSVASLPNSRFPAWSPDALQIAFSSSPITTPLPESNTDIYTIHIDGTGLVQLTTDPGYDANPSWSPDGKRLAFVSTRDSLNQFKPNYEIYVMNSDGTQQMRLNSNDGDIDVSVDADPAWSPDGTRIAFESNRTGNYDIYLMAPDGSNLVPLISGPTDDTQPAWSPGGDRLAFSSDRDGNFEIYILDMSSSAVTRITNDPASDNFPSWSSDGQWIVFSSNRDNSSSEIYKVNIATKSVIRLTSNEFSDYFPVWSK